MESTRILTRLSMIAAEDFDQPDLALSPATLARDAPGWDSLAHIQFLMQVENPFSIRFKSSEVSGFANAGRLMDRIKTRLGC